MRRLFASRTTSAAVAGILVLLVVGGGYGIAAVSSSGTIKACAQKGGNHSLYTGKCRKGDKKLSWNVKGPKGATGAAGATSWGATRTTSGVLA